MADPIQPNEFVNRTGLDGAAVRDAYARLPAPLTLIEGGPNSWAFGVFLTRFRDNRTDMSQEEKDNSIILLLVLKHVAVPDAPVEFFQISVPDPRKLPNDAPAKHMLGLPIAYETINLFIQDPAPSSTMQQLRTRLGGKFRPRSWAIGDLGLAAAFKGAVPLKNGGVPSQRRPGSTLPEILRVTGRSHWMLEDVEVHHSTIMREALQVEVDRKVGEETTAELVVCHACGQPGTRSTQTWEGFPQLKGCSECHLAQYCNRDCQKLDWTIGKHKALCKSYAMPAE